ncbi:MAG: hypothetical protein WA211_13525 [Candidatus Acidiferrales bacterium]
MNLSKRNSTFRWVDHNLCIISTAILLCAAIAWAGDPPWKSKPYQQWDDNDIHRILSDSPWVRVVSVSATWRTPGNSETQDLPAASGPTAGNSGSGPGVSQPSARGTSIQQGTPSAGQDSGGFPLEPYYVYWLSSKTVQEALAQRAVLHEGQSPAQAEKLANQPEPDYAILVQGTDMSPFLREDEKFFQDNSYLQLKKAGVKVSPVRVELKRDASGKSIVGAVLYFSKTSPNGQPLIQPDEKNIEFTCKLGTQTLKASFEPKKMVALSGPDL